MSAPPISRAHPSPSERWPRWLPVFAVAVLAALIAFAMPVLQSDVSAATSPSDDTLRAGAEVYSTICAQCHQAGGIGVAGKYPPLKDNPNVVGNPTYVEDVLRNGRTGKIVVNGETYDGQMPAQTALSDDDIANVIAYVQSGFQAPAGPVPEATGPVAGTELPLLSNYSILLAFLIFAGAAGLVLGPRVIAANDRRQITWVDASLKSGVIVVGMIVGTTIVPSKVLEMQTVQDLPRVAQDLIAVAIWLGALGAGLWALLYAHRERRI